MVMINPILWLPVFSTRAATKLQSRTWVWNKYFALLDTSTVRHHRQLWTGLQRWGAWRGGRTVLLTFVINHYTKALLYFSVLAQLLLKGQIFPEELRRKIYSTKEKLDKKKKKNTIFGDLFGEGKKNSYCLYCNYCLFWFPSYLWKYQIIKEYTLWVTVNM